MERSAPGARPSSTIEDYIVTVYRLAVAGRPVQGIQLADQLGVSPAAVTEMVGRLRAAGLLTGARRIELSEAGLAMARTLVSLHRLAERFLVDVLGLGWEDVHEEAHRLEHALSPRVTERLAEFLGHPQTCPHGHPIMEDGATEPDLQLQSLATLPPGAEGVVRRIEHEDHPLLAALTDLGITLGTSVRYLRGTDPLTVEIDAQQRSIPREIAAEVLVEAAARIGATP